MAQFSLKGNMADGLKRTAEQNQMRGETHTRLAHPRHTGWKTIDPAELSMTFFRTHYKPFTGKEIMPGIDQEGRGSLEL